jgi:hypothetical protein
MKKITPKKRVMRDEFLEMGIITDTGEIRLTYNLLTLRSNLTFIPENETQRPHKHVLITEAVHVLAGEIHVHHGGIWEKILQNQVALFDLNEFHNIKTGKINNSIEYPGAKYDTAAVAIVYKWIPPYLVINEDELTFVMENDWFGKDCEKAADDAKVSPLLKLEHVHQDRFWQIVKRNDILSHADLR